MHSDLDWRKLVDIRDNILLAKRFVADLDYPSFRAEPMRFYAVVRALEIVSEASRKLSSELKKRNPSIPWRDIAGAGSIYRHDYEDVMEQRVWQTVHEALPALLSVVEFELSRMARKA